MKRLTIASGLLASAACLCLHAESVNVKATIPFSFQVKNVVMPAGEYRLEETTSHVLMVRGTAAPHASAALIPLPDYRKGETEKGVLIFNRYGNQYFLSKVFTAGSERGTGVPKGTKEKEIVTRVASANTATVILAQR